MDLLSRLLDPNTTSTFGFAGQKPTVPLSFALTGTKNSTLHNRYSFEGVPPLNPYFPAPSTLDLSANPPINDPKSGFSHNFLPTQGNRYMDNPPQ